MQKVYLLGTRGVPNRYGGFERLVEVLAPYLARRGYDVTVTCEGQPEDLAPHRDLWAGVTRLFVPAGVPGPRGTILYDKACMSAVPDDAVALIFGYGTAIFQRGLRVRGVRHAVNVDGIEWQRAKWGGAARLWLRLNERLTARWSDILIADHPAIAEHVQRSLHRDAVMIAYGADVPPAEADGFASAPPGLADYPEDGFFLVIARPEPENNVREALEAYRRSSRRLPFVVVGNFDATPYGRELKVTYGEVRFAGAIYDVDLLDAMRRRSALYVHGHSVGGTNPSLIEAMAAGAIVCAHDNVYNRWVLGQDGLYFRGSDDLSLHLDDTLLQSRRDEFVRAARQACDLRFRWPDILSAYERVVGDLVRARGGTVPPLDNEPNSTITRRIEAS